MGSPLRGQFIARHEGRVAWVKMLGSEGVKSGWRCIFKQDFLVHVKWTKTV